MKVLQLSLHGCATLGFGPYQPTTRKYPINKKNLVALFIHFLALSSSFAFLFLDANTFQECAMSVYASTMLLLNIGLYFVFIWKNQTICDLLQTFENSVEKRESIFSIAFHFQQFHENTICDFRARTSNVDSKLREN